MKRSLCLLLLCALVGGLAAAEAVEVVEDREPTREGEPATEPATEPAPPAVDPAPPATEPAAATSTPLPPPAADGGVVMPAPTVEVPEDSAAVIRQQAADLAASGHRNQAIELLEAHVFVNPGDEAAKALLLGLRIEERKAEMRSILAQQADEKEFVLGDPGYEAAKARAPIHISRQLDLVEFLIQEQRFTEAAEQLQRIKDRHGDDEAVLTLLDRLLEHLVRLERRRLERERAIRRGEVVNDVIERGTMPREKRPLAREVLTFDEDIAALERENLLQQLRIKVGMISYENQPLSVILRDLFALAGLNYVIRDDALGAETLTISLVDETVEHVLEVIQRMVPVRFNYRGGSVYVTSADSPILVTEIIRLQAGLTDVLAQVEIGAQSGDGDDDGGGGLTPFGGGDDEEDASDLERFLTSALAADGLVDWPEGSTYYLDRKSNTLYVRSSPSAIAEVKRLLHALDYNNVQVLIEARFVLVESSAMDSIGINWAALGQQEGSGDQRYFFGGAQEDAINPLGVSPNQLATALTPGGGQGLRLGAVGIGEDLVPNFSVTLNALEERGDANVFSEPKILTLNNALGVISFQNDISYVARFTNQSSGTTNTQVDNGTVVNESQNVLVPEYETEQEEIRLQVRPSVARNADIITLHIHPLVRQFVGFAGDTEFANVPRDTAVLGNTPVRQPQFQRRELATTLHVKNGQTIVLGGLVSENDNRNRSGIPYLSRIPGAGLLFGTRSKDLQRAKLLIFVTVNIVDPTGAKFTEEVRHLRDTARISLTAEARDQERAREELEAAAAAQRAAERGAIEEDVSAGDGSNVPGRMAPGGQRRR